MHSFPLYFERTYNIIILTQGAYTLISVLLKLNCRQTGDMFQVRAAERPEEKESRTEDATGSWRLELRYDCHDTDALHGRQSS